MGLGPAPAAARLVDKNATGTPLGFDAAATPLPQAATATPRRAGGNAHPGALPRAPHPPRKAKEEELELIEAEEIPESSSDAPTLDALRLEAAHADLPHGKRATDDFLVNLSVGTQGILGAPTIDVSDLHEAAPASLDRVDVDVDIVGEDEVELYRPPRAERSGTVPLFDMAAVLPKASDSAKGDQPEAAAAISRASDSPASVSLPAPSKGRERKFVVVPETPTAAAVPAPASKRASRGLWLGLLAVAAAVAALVSTRGHRPEAAFAPEASAEPAQVPTTSAVAEAATIEPPAASSAGSATASARANAAPPAPSPHAAAPLTPSITAAVSAPNSTSGSTNAKPAPEPALEQPAPAPETPAVAEEPAAPAEPSKPVEAHNAPPPAADGTEFDRDAARNALASAAAQASACRKDGDPSGTATITITFAPSGRITSANLQGPPFAGTPTGGCIANTMRHATIPAFSGEHVTVTKTIVVQ